MPRVGDHCRVDYRHATPLLLATLLSAQVFGASETLPVPAKGIYLGIRADPNLAANQKAPSNYAKVPRPTVLNLHYL